MLVADKEVSLLQPAVNWGGWDSSGLLIPAIIYLLWVIIIGEVGAVLRDHQLLWLEGY